MPKTPPPAPPVPPPVPPPPPLIEVRDLRVERERVILDGINWRVRAGENWVLLGANGSGKTSLLAVLTGYLAESAGSVSIAGATRGEDDWRELRKRVGLVSAAFDRRVAGDESALAVVAGGRSARVNLFREPSPAERRGALALMRRTRCEHVATQPWRTLSQGERQRALVARALFSGLDVLILDEPCAGLDPRSREEFLALLGELATGGTTGDAPVPLVLVTHHVEEITPVFTHALLLREGRVLAAGPLRPTLTAGNLSALFDAPARLRKTGGRYALTLTT
ncbi:MAG: ATP-binding cassette domain-containing protein [Puniceicoccales bacterium]|jgi:iron complex transport system ATP-binding protein|nr:ATP-binding cassette domain-containing protein [Puniceicoccales bacterium]